jgi:hypothetical protein
MFILMILYDFCLLPSQFCYTYGSKAHNKKFHYTLSIWYYADRLEITGSNSPPIVVCERVYQAFTYPPSGTHTQTDI